MSLNRKRRVLRNLLVSLLLLAVCYVSLGAPAYTVQARCRQMERKYLLNEPLEPIFSQRFPSPYTNDGARSYTFIIARSGDSYLSFLSERNGLVTDLHYQRVPTKLANELLCAACWGTLYVAGDFEQVASAQAVVETEETTRLYDPDTGEHSVTRGPKQRTFTYVGEKLGDELFAFRYQDEDHQTSTFGWVAEEDYDLGNVASEWYSRRNITNTTGGRGILHADVPVTVTLYDEAGAVLQTLDLTVDTYELYDWYS